ncbi:hypothetical protein LR48_Vigan11g008800 [Vigna angularis]|uniref:Uncharacterized protein n=1 Tax=Phaseolus angularis TaxID=3914 RepID=A0A0L9VPR7_PHAAN|nr:uncharacterized protein HKW66_Vig0168180 [Vigna angularis]KOM57056.1 hypothetical protein LR48_Vigan11g008800 [Vigna angularis]
MDVEADVVDEDDGASEADMQDEDDVDNHHKDEMEAECEVKVKFGVEADNKGDDKVEVESWIESQGHDLGDNDDATRDKSNMKVLRM